MSSVREGADFFAGGGEMGALMRAYDWGRSTLGPPEKWPQSLRAMIRVMLNTNHPMFIWWGPDLIQFYNDAYRKTMGPEMHPAALGAKGRESWHYVWHIIGPQIEHVMAGKGSTWDVERLVPILRHGGQQNVWWTYSYGPIDLEGEVGGVLVVCNDVTEQHLAKEALRNQTRRFEQLFEQAPGVIAMLEGPDHVFTLANASYRSLVGHRNIIGLPVRVALPEVEEQGFIELLDRVYASGEPYRGDGVPVKLVRSAQLAEERFIDFIYQPVSGSFGEVTGIFIEGYDVTERVRAQSSLRESETRYRTLFEAVEAGFCIIEMIFDEAARPVDYRFVEANPAFERQTGLKNAAGRTARELVPDLEEHWFEVYGRIALTGEAARFEQGSEPMGRWFDVHAFCIGPSEARRVAILFNDITERRRAEKRLRDLNLTLEQRVAEALAERELLAHLVENTDAFVQVVDLDFRWLAINRAAADEYERITGVRPKVGDSMLDLLADKPEHQAAVQAAWKRALAGEGFTQIGDFGETGVERRSYEMKYHVLRDSGGELVGAYQFAYDVTDRVREQERLAKAEAARREADALYRAYFQNSPEALFVIAVEAEGGFVVEQVNPAHEEGLGFKLAEVRGQRIEAVLPPEVAERVLAAYRQVVESGSILQYREAFDLGGRIRHWDTSIVPVRGIDGAIARLIGSSREVTRQVLAEEALRQSQKMEAMGQLTGGVAHDFNNLLTPIVGSLDMLQRKGVGGEREQRLIAAAIQSAERAKTLVQRLLAFARRQPLQAVPVDIAKLVRAMGDLVTSTTGPKIKVVVDAPDNLPPAKADANQLEMALLNLAVNARDAMPEGGTLRITASSEWIEIGHLSGLKQGNYIKLSVADTGAGMNEATLNRAVEPFFSTKGVGQGTGLGLSMVHGLASQLGGALAIGSQPGLGTNVELWLPQSSEALEVELMPAEPAVLAVSRRTALLVDDEEAVRTSTAEMLRELGFEVVETASAEEAIWLISRGEQFDVLVTDHLMPGMSGTDLAREVRAISPDTGVLLVSGYAEYAGIDPTLPRLTKPFRKDELAAGLAQLSV